MYYVVRWIRDQLLTFQDMVFTFNQFLQNKLQSFTSIPNDCTTLEREQAISMFIDSLTEKDVDEDELDLFIFHSLMQIRKEYLSNRVQEEDEELIDAIPSFDQYVR